MAVKIGDKVTVEYTGTFEDGTVFDSTSHDDHSHPLEFEVGKHEVIPGFEDAVIGMEKGDTKKVEISPDDAYGQPDPNLEEKVPKEFVPDSQNIKAGEILVMGLPNGQEMPIRVKDVTEKEVVFDLNHPLAGKTLHFSLKVVGVESGK